MENPMTPEESLFGPRALFDQMHLRRFPATAVPSQMPFPDTKGGHVA
jgi:hypothetical protein